MATSDLLPNLMRYTPPVASIFQFYKVFRYIIFLISHLPLITPHTQFTSEQFRYLWERSNEAAKDLIVFMWAIGELTIPLGHIEITVGSPSFFISRFCARAIIGIRDHQKFFFNNPNLKNQTIHVQPYNNEETKTVQEIIDNNQLRVKEAIKSLAQEDYTLLYETKDTYNFLNNHFPHIFRHANLGQFVTHSLQNREIVIQTELPDLLSPKSTPSLNFLNPQALYSWTTPEPQRKS